MKNENSYQTYTVKICVLDFNTQSVISQVKINHVYYEECHGISNEINYSIPLTSGYRKYY